MGGIKGDTSILDCSSCAKETTASTLILRLQGLKGLGW